MSIDQFLGHSNRGSRQKLMKDWTDTPEHAITIWLHTRAPILALWRHNWKVISVREKDRVTTREVWNERLVCYEDEEVLKNQEWRDKSSGERETAPKLCPVCLMIEHVRRDVREGRMSWTQPIFQFKGDDPKKNVTVLAAGLWNGFGAKELAPEQRKMMADVPPQFGGPVYARDAWKQNLKAKLEYAFTVVDDAAPENGVQVTVQSNLLGQKVQEVISKSIKELGREDGNPAVKPYAIRWEYDPREDVEFSKKYDALRMSRVQLRPAIAQLIRGEAPSLAKLAERFNLETLRANMERHSLVKLPFDEFFAPARAAAKPGTRVPDVGTAPDAFAPPTYLTGDDGQPEVVRETKEELFGCDSEGCDGVMRATDTQCVKCGRKYVVEQAAPVPPPQPALPKRSTAVPVAAPVQVKIQDNVNASDESLGFAPNGVDTYDDIPF